MSEGVGAWLSPGSSGPCVALVCREGLLLPQSMNGADTQEEAGFWLFPGGDGSLMVLVHREPHLPLSY